MSFAIGLLKKGVGGGLLSGMLFQYPGLLMMSFIGWGAEAADWENRYFKGESVMRPWARGWGTGVQEQYMTGAVLAVWGEGSRCDMDLHAGTRRLRVGSGWRGSGPGGGGGFCAVGQDRARQVLLHAHACGRAW